MPGQCGKPGCDTGQHASKQILLTKIIYLLYAGDTFLQQEATTLFFGVTKLFQHKDPALRQMVYLVIKELSDKAEDVIMVTSSIMKDMQPNLEVIYRPNAIRTLCRIIDGQMLQGVERFYKSAIVDRNSSISSAAIVSAYQLYPTAKDVIRRWANETQEAIQAKSTGSAFGSSYGAGSSYLGGFNANSNAQSGYQAVQSNSFITQYHAIGLLYVIRQQDRMAVSKIIQQLSAGGKSSTALRSPYAICMLIRFVAKVMDEDPKCVGAGLPRDSSERVAQLAQADVRAARKLPPAQERHGQLRGRPRHLRDALCLFPGAIPTHCRSVDASLSVLTDHRTRDSPAIVPQLAQVVAKVCRHPDAEQAGAEPAECRGDLQPGDGEADQRRQSLRRYVCYHHAAEGAERGLVVASANQSWADRPATRRPSTG
jgi:hypothetical protein